VAGYAGGWCATLAAAKAACDAMPTCAGFKYLHTGCFSFVLDDSDLRAYVFSKHATIAGTPATLSAAAAADNGTASSGAFDGVYLKVGCCKLKPELKALGFSASNYDTVNCFQVLLSILSFDPTTR
jgi:hypothetical protein